MTEDTAIEVFTIYVHNGGEDDDLVFTTQASSLDAPTTDAQEVFRDVDLVDLMNLRDSINAQLDDYLLERLEAQANDAEGETGDDDQDAV